MKTKMKEFGLFLLGLVSASVTSAFGPGSCLGRCGEDFVRGKQCTCDISCLQHNECCPDFQVTCTSAAQSCQGRCGETFRRGLSCDCDPQCLRYQTCCSDYQRHCDASVTTSHHGSSQPLRSTASRSWKPQRSREGSNSESEEWHSVRGRCSRYPGGRCPRRFGLPVRVASNPASPNYQHQDGNTAPAHLLPGPVSSLPHGARPFPALNPSQPSNSAPALSSSGSVSPPASPGAIEGGLNVQLVMIPGRLSPPGPGQAVGAPAGLRPSTMQDVAQALGLSVGGGAPVESGTGFLDDADLCSDSPINGLTALSNGTILIFKGGLFWSLDSIGGSVGPPQNITEALGVPSPIDTIFTRLNCIGNTYIIKGDQYWRLDGNMAMEPGYPKPLTFEFPGLTGSIGAALAVPASSNRPESVYFFKPGDILQRFIFPPSNTPSCDNKPRSTLMQNALHQPEAADFLSGEINIRVSLKGFSTPITSALSMAPPQGHSRYQHFVFSGPLFFRVQISGDLPALIKPDPPTPLPPLPIQSPLASLTDTAALHSKPPHPINSIRFWLRCP